MGFKIILENQLEMKLLKYFQRPCFKIFQRILMSNKLHVNFDDPIVSFTTYGFHSDLLEGSIIKCNKSQELPNQIVISPNNYVWFGKNYNCTKSGVYRFSLPQIESRQHVVLDKYDVLSNALNLANIAVRGNKDDTCSMEKLLKNGLIRFLSLTCGPLVNMVENLLLQHGITCRKVHGHTIESMNSYNNGHTMIEIWHNDADKFVVVDLDKKSFFTDRDGKYLSLFELSESIFRKLPWKMIPGGFTNSVDLVNFEDKNTKFNYGFIEHSFYNRKHTVRSVIERICQIPIIERGSEMVVCAWNKNYEKLLMEKHADWKIVNPDIFLKEFYSNNKS